MIKYLIALDRDGTINVDQGYTGSDPGWREKFALMPNVISGLRKLLQIKDAKIVVVSNQVGVARGFVSLETVVEINRVLSGMLKAEGIELDGWFQCCYAPIDYAMKKGIPLDSPWIKDTDLRKPDIGMLRQAAESFGMTLDDFSSIYTMGDKATDVQTGLNAGGKGIFLLNSSYPEEIAVTRALHSNLAYISRVFFAEDFSDGADLIIRDINQ
ncbi:MAG: HAD-IIIA family hydrolase [Candidatus Woesearchaeota archaeon]